MKEQVCSSFINFLFAPPPQKGLKFSRGPENQAKDNEVSIMDWPLMPRPWLQSLAVLWLLCPGSRNFFNQEYWAFSTVRPPVSQITSASLGCLLPNSSLLGFTIRVSAVWPNCDLLFSFAGFLVIYPGFFICFSLNLLSKYISAELKLFLFLFLLAPQPILKAASLNSQFISG